MTECIFLNKGKKNNIAKLDNLRNTRNLYIHYLPSEIPESDIFVKIENNTISIWKDPPEMVKKIAVLTTKTEDQAEELRNIKNGKLIMERKIAVLTTKTEVQEKRIAVQEGEIRKIKSGKTIMVKKGESPEFDAPNQFCGFLSITAGGNCSKLYAVASDGNCNFAGGGFMKVIACQGPPKFSNMTIKFCRNGKWKITGMQFDASVTYKFMGCGKGNISNNIIY